jgi:hypothetical protein
MIAFISPALKPSSSIDLKSFGLTKSNPHYRTPVNVDNS